MYPMIRDKERIFYISEGANDPIKQLIFLVKEWSTRWSTRKENEPIGGPLRRAGLDQKTGKIEFIKDPSFSLVFP